MFGGCLVFLEISSNIAIVNINLCFLIFTDKMHNS